MEECIHGLMPYSCHICSGTKNYQENKLKEDIRLKKKAQKIKAEQERIRAEEREKLQRKNRICTKIINEAEMFVGDIAFEEARGDLSKVETMGWDQMRNVWAEAIFGHSATFRKMMDCYPNLMEECLEICSVNYGD